MKNICPKCGANLDKDRTPEDDQEGCWRCPWIPKKQENTCDDCASQEGRHYCLLHSVMIKNMDLMGCDDFERKSQEKAP